MNIALIGYGKMGHEIEQIAIQRGHQIVARIDLTTNDTFESPAFCSANVAIEFTRPDAAINNIRKCFEAGVPVVCGTTGWANQLSTIRKEMETTNGTLFWASNFSLGVNLFFALNRYLAKLMNPFNDYNISMIEVHHTQKLDAPSGTAITLAESIIEELDRKSKWVKDIQQQPDELAIASIREGNVLGIHEIIYESEMDTISIKHDAKSRRGFALGAVLAAEFTYNKKGFLGMNDLLAFL
ncbi:4-hydroxy-tetrahydrodipicolinate reductase [Microbacter margulisiae]|uniref:4-hydroxy-tetrahydrodipicolinate reductase n=1 Tax=Microbacter margulisiae TaxID=1350067 RepID=A0A7W5DS29_9PORP|nr:4-hydroxy-tetrahydrodipicolinate reductase [Microbacter margulisiae]MBB3188037.1 4-hydroxy-tetrahydrodipicolinate reductase [Microbacter margulisiae]